MKSVNTSSAAIPFSLRRKIAKLEKKYYAKVTFPEELEHGFDGLIGMQTEKETLKDAVNFFKNIEMYSEGNVLCPNTRYLLRGNPGAGKTPLLNALAKECNVPMITFSASTFTAFPNKVTKLIDLVFSVSDAFSQGCIIVFAEFAIVGNLESEHESLLHNHLVTKISQSTNTVIFLSTTTETITIPPFYLGHNLFDLNKGILIMPPTLETRKQLLSKFFKDYGVESANEEFQSFIERLARNTLGMYPKSIEYVVKETILRAMRNESKQLTFKDFHETLLTMEAGEKYNKLTEKERKATAYHEAGHVIAAYYSDPNYILGRVEITPRAQSLGLTLEEMGEEKFSYFESDIRNKIIYDFGGMAAEKLIYGQTSAGVSADLINANGYATAMVSDFGMCEELGPIVLDDEVGFSSEKFYAECETASQKILKDLYDKTYKIVSEHKNQLEALAKALLEHEVLVGDEIKEVLLASEEEEKNK